ncbi:hypothetical protein KW786_01140 [Candidatus Parcubacteria bacterium]|nr:hypothetical protein [Candidatus Parcubacteria bacterium]
MEILGVMFWLAMFLFFFVVGAVLLVLFLAFVWRILIPGAIILSPLIIGITLCSFLWSWGWENLGVLALLVWTVCQVAWGVCMPWKELGDSYEEFLQSRPWIDPLTYLNSLNPIKW